MSICASSFIPISAQATKRDFNKNYSDIMIVTNYLLGSEYSCINMWNTSESGTMFTGLETGRVKIDDSQVVASISTLFKRGYSVIGKTDGAIYFQRSTRGTDFGSGVVYSPDGNTFGIEYLTRIEALSIDKWYYYESDYNVDKSRQKDSRISNERDGGTTIKQEMRA